MEKIKNYYLRLVMFLKNKLGQPRRRIIILLALVFFGITAYLFIAFLSVGRMEIALAELKQSFAPDIICHEKCALFRQAREKLIIAELRVSKNRASKILAETWRGEELSEFKQELVKILFLAYGEGQAPPYLKSYILESEADLNVVREIVFRFPELALGNQEFKKVLAAGLANASSLEKRIEFMKILREIASDTEIDSYFTVLLSDGEAAFKREAIKNISNIKDKTSHFTLEQLDIIKTLVLRDSSAQNLRRDLVFLIGDYYLVFPNEAAIVWRDIYNKTELDSISRLLAADSLNHLQKSALTLPEVSAAEWDEYYNN